MLLKLLSETDDLKTLSKWCQTSKRINRICRDEGLWKEKYLRNFGETRLMVGDTWRGRYKRRASFGRNSPISNCDDYYGVIDENGKLYMAGYNNYGQLGNGTLIYSRMPIFVPFRLKVVSISCSDIFSGAVTEDGAVCLWGNLTYFDKENRANIVKSPIKQKLQNKALKISCWSHHIAPSRNAYPPVETEGSSIFAVIFEDLSVYFRGYLESYEKNVEGRFSIQARDVYTEDGFIAIITTDFKFYYWGNLPYESTRNDFPALENLSLHLVSLPEPIKQASFGEESQVYLSTTGKVYVKGSNHYDLLGKSSYIIEETYKTKKLKFPSTISFISSGYNSAAAISESGQLFVWGTDTLAGSKPNRPEYDSRPVEVNIGSPVNYVSINGSFLAITADGMVNVFDRSMS